MAYFFQPSLGGLLAQAIGALFMAALCIALLRTMRRPALRVWAAGWVMLSVSLQGLYIASYFEAARLPGQILYLFGEYVFGYCVISGFRQYATGVMPQRRERWLLAPLLAFAFLLARFAGGNINALFAVHTLVFAYLFFAALQIVRRVRPAPHSSLGLRVTKISLLLLTIDYLHYAPLFGASSAQNLAVIDAYLMYAPLYDLIFQVMLMFGMVMLVTGQVQHELELANADLSRARDRLETTAREDPLTGALNRRAFADAVEARLRTHPRLQGTVVVVDLDDLKALNDSYGHEAGDVALRLVTEALRARMTPGDLLFRWGGDEFVLLLGEASADVAESRFASANEALRQVSLPGAPQPLDLRASVGASVYQDAASIEAAITLADEAMYRRKKSA
jgi:diguanylate cyclase (GGDEF)-like protein